MFRKLVLVIALVALLSACASPASSESNNTIGFEPAQIAIATPEGQIVLENPLSVDNNLFVSSSGSFPITLSLNTEQISVSAKEAQDITIDTKAFKLYAFGMPNSKVSELMNSGEVTTYYANDSSAQALTGSPSYGNLPTWSGAGDIAKVIIAIACGVVAGETIIYVMNAVQESSATVSSSSSSSSSTTIETGLVQTDWTNLTAQLEAFAATTYGHAEMGRLVSTAQDLSRKCPGAPNIIECKGDGRSSGSIQIRAGHNGKTATIAVAIVVSQNVAFFWFEAPISLTGNSLPPGDAVRMGEYFFRQSQIVTKAAWMMSDTIGNTDMSAHYLGVDGGLARYQAFCNQHNLNFTLAEFRLPF